MSLSNSEIEKIIRKHGTGGWQTITSMTTFARAIESRVEHMAKIETERLDWLEQQRKAYGFQDIHEGNRWCVEGPFATLRQLIDVYSLEEKEAYDATHSQEE